MPATQQTCGDCGDVFYGRADATYCSPACRQRSYRKRNEHGERLHQLGKAPTGLRVAGRLPRTVARNTVNYLLTAGPPPSSMLENIYLGEIPTDIATKEQVDATIEDTRATLAFLLDLRRHIAGGSVL